MKTKTLFRRFLPLAAVLSLQLAATVQAQLIDVDFNTNGAASTHGGPAIGPTMSGVAVLGAAGDHWNGIDVASGTGIPLFYANGSNSPVTMTFTSGGGYDANSFGGSTPFADTPYDALMEDYLFNNGVTQTVTLAGLQPNSRYDLALYNAADINAVGRTTFFTVNSNLQSSTWNGSSSTLIAGVDYSSFTNAMTDSSGNLVINWSGNGTAEGDLDGFQIQRQIGQAAPGLDPTFAGTGQTEISFGSNCVADAVAIQPDGRIVVAGETNNVNSLTGLALARLNTDGSLDLSFGVNGKIMTPVMASASAVAIQSDGKIVVAGGDGGFQLARYNTNGSLDSSFGTNGIAEALFNNAADGTAQAVGIQSNGDIVVAGFASGPSGAVFAVARFNTNGALDASFGRAGEATTLIESSDGAYGLGIQPDGKIVVGGFAGTIDSATTVITELDFAAARYQANGALDLSFGSLGRTTGNVGGGSYDFGYAMALQPDGKVIVAGVAALELPIGVSSFVGLVRFNTNGTPDATFGNDGSVVTEIGTYGDEGLAVALQSNGKILVAGASGNIHDQWFVQRLNPDGSPDTTYGDNSIQFVYFNSGTDELARAMAVDSSGRAVVAGDAGGLFGVARILPDDSSLSLKISLTATNAAVVSWPYPSAGWNLQQNSDFTTTNWITPPETINNDGTNNFIVVRPQSGHLFFRLVGE